MRALGGAPVRSNPGNTSNRALNGFRGVKRRLWSIIEVRVLILRSQFQHDVPNIRKAAFLLAHHLKH